MDNTRTEQSYITNSDNHDYNQQSVQSSLSALKAPRHLSSLNDFHMHNSALNSDSVRFQLNQLHKFLIEHIVCDTFKDNTFTYFLVKHDCSCLSSTKYIERKILYYFNMDFNIDFNMDTHQCFGSHLPNILFTILFLQTVCVLILSWKIQDGQKEGKTLQLTRGCLLRRYQDLETRIDMVPKNPAKERICVVIQKLRSRERNHINFN